MYNGIGLCLFTRRRDALRDGVVLVNQTLRYGTQIMLCGCGMFIAGEISPIGPIRQPFQKVGAQPQ